MAAKPQPTALKIARGNPGKRKLRTDEPEFTPGFGSKPAYLKGIASDEWDRVASDLVDAGLAHAVTRAALEGYCVAYARWRNAEDRMGDDDMIYDEEHKRWQRNPLLIIANKAMEQFLKFMTEFGMTPSSKTKAATFSTPKSQQKKNPFSVVR
jgi:P27 family predicted phage terminase small subunit